MKFSPTVPLALVLAAGMAAAAAAQTAPGSLNEPKSSISSEPKSTIAKPLTGSMQPQQGLNDIKAPDNKAASSAQVKSVEPKAKSAEMKAMQASSGRTAHLRQPAMQAQAQQNFRPDQVKAAQEQLRSAGLYNGPTDGMMDPDTRAALARFQQQNGLRRTQTLDPQTLARLNTGQTS